MNRQSNVPLNTGAAPVFSQQQTGRLPQNYRDGMIHMTVRPENSDTRTSDMAAKKPAQRRSGHFCENSCFVSTPTAGKWKSSFKPVDDELSQDGNSQDKSTSSSERTELYDPYDPGSSDSEPEMLRRGPNHNHTPPDQDNNLARQRLSPDRGSHEKHHWHSSISEPGRQPLDRHDIKPETRPTESRGLSPGHGLLEQQAYCSDTESLDRPGYRSISGSLDHRSRSPDRLIHGSSSQQFPASYGEQGANREMNATTLGQDACGRHAMLKMDSTFGLSPPASELGYQHQLGHVGTGLDQTRPSKEFTKNRSKHIIMDKLITCDLCNVEFANGQELQDHLDSKSHWDTLEHIQQQNSYDDLAIAFLQDVMLHKSRQPCSRAIEYSALEALQQNDHMTKVEMFHCASCQVFIPTSVSSVQSHITSQEHLANAKEFEVQQRHTSLDKAEIIMTELKPQFEHFLKGGSPFV